MAPTHFLPRSAGHLSVGIRCPITGYCGVRSNDQQKGRIGHLMC